MTYNLKCPVGRTRKSRCSHAQKGDDLAAGRLQPLAGRVAAGGRGAAVSLSAQDVRHLAVQTAISYSDSVRSVVFVVLI